MDSDADEPVGTGAAGYGVTAEVLVDARKIVQILPCRLRSRDVEDIVVVKESAIELYTLTAESDVADDFMDVDDGSSSGSDGRPDELYQFSLVKRTRLHGRVRAAAVIPPEELRRPAARAASVPVASSRATLAQIAEAFRDGRESPAGERRRSATAESDGSSASAYSAAHEKLNVHRRTEGADVLALVTDQGFLLLATFEQLFARQSPERVVAFSTTSTDLNEAAFSVFAAVPLSAPRRAIGPRLQTCGRSIDIDSRANALLIPAHQSCVKVVALGRTDAHQAYFSEMRELEVDGVVLDARFLELDDDGRNCALIAVFYVDDYGSAKFNMYLWFVDTPLARLKQYCTAKISSGLTLPLLSVPVAHGNAIVYFAETAAHYVLATDIISVSQNVPEIAYPAEVLAAGALPTQVFRPRARGRLAALGAAVRDYVYVAFDSGAVYVLVVGDGRTELVLYTRLDSDVGAGFCVREGDGTDVVLAGGEARGGGVYLVAIDDALAGLAAARPGWPGYAAECWYDFAGVGPLADCEVLNTPDTAEGRMFVCSGFRASGALTHVRQGIEAELVMKGPKLRGSIATFAVTQTVPDLRSYIVVSYPWKSAVYTVDQSDTAQLKLVDVSTAGMLDSDAPTLLLTNLGEGHILQVTTRATVVSNLGAAAPSDRYEEPGTAITLADVDRQHGILVMAMAGPGGEKLALVALADGTNRHWAYADLVWGGRPYEPTFALTALKIASSRAGIFLLAATNDHRLYAGRITRDGILPQLAELRVDALPPADVVESIAFHGGPAEYVLLGLRSGGLVVGTFAADGPAVAAPSLFRVDRLPLRVQYTNIDHEYLVYSHRFWRVAVVYNGAHTVTINEVLVDDFADKQVMSGCCLDLHDEQLVFCMIGNHLNLVQLGRAPGEVLSQIRIGETPRRLLYIDHVQAFAVAVVSRERALAFVDPIDKLAVAAVWPDNLFGAGDTVNGMCEYEIVVGDKIYRYLAVAMAVTRGGARAGRGMILRLTNTVSAARRRSSAPLARQIEIKKLVGWDFDRPAYAVCQFVDQAVLFSTGTAVVVKPLQTSEGPRVEAELELGSPVVAMSVRDEFVVVSTLNNSVHVLAFAGGRLAVVESDLVARNMIHHHICRDGFVLACDKQRTLLGFATRWERPQRVGGADADADAATFVGPLSPTIAGTLQTALSRLRTGRFRPAWMPRRRPAPADEVRLPADDAPAEGGRDGGRDGAVDDFDPDNSVIGTGLDGMVYGLNLVGRDEYDRLARAQQLLRTALECYLVSSAEWAGGRVPLELAMFYDGRVELGNGPPDETGTVDLAGGVSLAFGEPAPAPATGVVDGELLKLYKLIVECCREVPELAGSADAADAAAVRALVADDRELAALVHQYVHTIVL
ncbi:mono-functional DNA-alkylating methyl methanesulfonate N-term-domain-containing protein [Dipodascopsis tothii]|uniref:mono-functional DNA-alkylating methyl methanesulfonate N-term-domain-containing protein n=1 Tax=Dipodascopsis tothii TaxID=44089 RepID=UPI0034CE3DBE